MKLYFIIVLCVFLGVALSTKKTQYCRDVAIGDRNETRGFTVYPAPNDNHTVYVVSRRFPRTGFYDKPISCVIIIDKTEDSSAGDVEVTMGSPEPTAVGIKFMSTPGRIMAYEIQVYTEN